MLTYLVCVALFFLAMLIHEGAHAGAAWLLGIPIKNFSIGMPWPSWLTLKLGKFRLSPFLFMAGVELDSEIYLHARFWKKAYVALVGPLANLVVGLASAYLFLGSQTGRFVAQAITSANIQSLAMLVTGKVGLNLLVSPIGLMAIFAGILRNDLIQGALLFWLVLCFGIPAINLLPIPALDGGQILTGAICSVQGNTPKAIRGAKMVTACYFVVLLAGMAILVIRDVLSIL